MKTPYLFILSQDVGTAVDDFHRAICDHGHRHLTLNYFIHAMLHPNRMSEPWLFSQREVKIPKRLQDIYEMKRMCLDDPQVLYWTSTPQRYANLINYIFLLARKMHADMTADGLSEIYCSHINHYEVSPERFKDPIPYFGPIKFSSPDNDSLKSHSDHLEMCRLDATFALMNLNVDE